jgi:nuclear transport factor 2 (NTF2) superfamily protein
MEKRFPLPPFTFETATQKVQAAEDGQWHRSYGNEMWEFDADGYMQKRYASINDMEIKEAERKFK